LFSLAALLLMVVNQNCSKVQHFQASLSTIITPVQYLVNFPIYTVNTLIDNLSSKEKLLKENEALKVKLSLLNSKLQKQFALKSENKQLRALLQSSAQIEHTVSSAELLAVSIDPFVHQVIINKGKKNNIFIGQPVLDANGVMGQVIQVEPFTSRVMLITDSRSAIPVQIKRNGIRAIAIGYGASNKLKLQNITETTDIKINDMLVTSGLGHCYPFGYPVGTVTAIQHDPGKEFADITIKPTARLDHSRLVLLVWSAQHYFDSSPSQNISSKKRP
jgi:rod shape-determining protein MreC